VAAPSRRDPSRTRRWINQRIKWQRLNAAERRRARAVALSLSISRTSIALSSIAACEGERVVV
jgi:hypothetical protein